MVVQSEGGRLQLVCSVPRSLCRGLPKSHPRAVPRSFAWRRRTQPRRAPLSRRAQPWRAALWQRPRRTVGGAVRPLAGRAGLARPVRRLGGMAGSAARAAKTIICGDNRTAIATLPQRLAPSGAASAWVRPRPAARAVGGHCHRHGRPRFAPDVAGQLHRRTNGRLSAPSSFLSCPLRQPFLQAALGCKRLYVRRSAICGHAAPRGRVRHHRRGLVRDRRHHQPT